MTHERAVGNFAPAATSQLKTPLDLLRLEGRLTAKAISSPTSWAEGTTPRRVSPHLLEAYSYLSKQIVSGKHMHGPNGSWSPSMVIGTHFSAVMHHLERQLPVFYMRLGAIFSECLLLCLLFAFVKSSVIPCVIPGHHEVLQGFVLDCTKYRISRSATPGGRLSSYLHQQLHVAYQTFLRYHH